MRFRQTLAVRHEPAGIGRARDAVRALLQEWDLCVDHDLVVLLLSETVTNAVSHGSPPVTMRITWDAQTLRVSVRDAGVELPCLQAPDDDAESGRGLRMLEALADRWGIEVGERSKTVWFEVGHRPEGDSRDVTPVVADVIAFEGTSYLLLAANAVEPAAPACHC